MDTREKLIGLLADGPMCPQGANCGDCPYSNSIKFCDQDALMADHLIANDVVPVVRCKDCKHRGSNLCPMETVELYPWFGTKNEAFCSYGERREKE